MAKSIGLLCFVFLDILVLCMGRSKVHHYDFVLKETNFTKLCSTKSMLTVNDSFPGPVITVHKGDLVYVNVHNHGKYGVTIHWHGVKQPRNPWSDGPENITQCPIQPGTNFTQEIILSDEEGTLWWHAHSDWSRATVHGALVILPPDGNYPFPKPHFEEIIVLGSWYKGDVMAIYDEAVQTGSFPSISDAHTINGFTGTSIDCPTGETFRMKISSGKTYLLRIVNAVMNEEQFFGIAHHNLTLVCMDGSYTQPLTTHYLMITPGQTMDVLFTADQAPSHYYMVSAPFYDGDGDIDNTSAKGVIQYLGNYNPPSTIPSPTLPELSNATAAFNFTASLKSLATPEHPVNVPKNVTRHIFIAISLNVLPCPPGGTCKGHAVNGEETMESASLNNVSFSIPKIDILQAYYRKINNVYTEDFPNSPKVFNYTGNVTDISVYTTQGTKVIMMNYGEAVEIVLQGTAIQSPENHPIHLHGFSFYMVGIGSGNFNNSKDLNNYNLENPPRLNTIGVPTSGWVAIRFFANNPGVWFVHCHLERHTTWGMDTVLIVKNGSTPQTSIRKSPAYMPPCSAS